MHLRKLSDLQLTESLKSKVQTEREILTDILKHIAEVERRKLYLKLAFASLFAYLTEHIGYSRSSAQRRIDAARLGSEVTELNEKLESGKINLAQISIVQMAVRDQRKKMKPVSAEQKRNLLEKLEGQSFETTQRIIAETFDLPVLTQTKVQMQKDESVRLEVTLTKEQWEKLQRMREMLSTSLPDGSWDEVLTHVAEKIIEQKERAPQRAKPSEGLIKESTKRIVLQRDKCCRYQDAKTKRLCGSKWNLQVDHILPIWAGGGHELENLQALCAAHNQQKYKRESGIIRAR